MSRHVRSSLAVTRAAVVPAALLLSAGAAARIDSQWSNPLGGAWNVGTNWSTSPAFPNAPTDTASIGLVTGAAYTVALSSAVSLASLTLNSADAILSQSAGTLSMNGGTITITAGSYRLAGGTISAATIAGAGLTTFGSSGTLSGVTLDTNLSIINNYDLGVSAGLTLNAGRTISLASGANFTNLNFLGAGDQSLGGGGEVVFDGTSSSSGAVRATSGTLVIGAGTTIRSGTQGGAVGNQGLVRNNGTIAARTSGKTITATAVTNEASGVLEASNGGTLTLGGAWSNAGTLLVNTDGVLNLGGSFGTASVAPARFNRTGGTVNITGALANTGNTLALDAATGSFNLSGGTITGGTVSGTAGSSLNTAGSSGTLAGGVTLDTNVSIINNYDLNVSGGLTLNAGRTISVATGFNFTILEFLGAGNQTLAGGGEVVFDGTNSSNGFVRANSGSLTIGSGFTIRSGLQGGNVGQSGTINNDGTIAARTNARTIIATAVTNNVSGILEATNGGTLTMAGAWANSGTLLLDANAGSTINLGGSFSSASVSPARWSRAGGVVNITGTLNNSTLTLNADTGSFNLNGGTINGGAVTATAGAALNAAGVSGTLSGGVTLDTDFSLINNYTLSVNGGLTVNAGRAVSLNSGANFTILDFLGAGNQTLAGGGEVVFNGTGSTTGYIRANSGTLVIGAGTTVRSGTQGGNVGQSGLISNNGTIAARTNARTIIATAVTNNVSGILEATNGGTLALAGAWANSGTLLLDANAGSTLNLGGTFGTAAVAPARWSRTGGTVNITGTLTNTANTLTLNAATGSFNLNGGTINGGTVATPGDLAALNAAGVSGTLSGGVTLDTDFSLINNYTLSVNGGLTVNAGRAVSLNSGANFTVLDFLGAGNQTLAGGGEVVFNGTTSSTGFVRANSGTLVIDTAMTVRSGTQGGNVGQSGSLTNKGVVSAQTAGKTLFINGTNLDNQGVMKAENGGTLSFTRAGGLTSNTGADLLARTGGTLRFNSGMNVANNGGFDLEVASASQTVGYGRIAITGNAAIGGSDIDLIFTGGFTPDWGDTFTILSFTTLTGDMSTLALPSLADPTLRWWREQTATNYRVGVRHIADNNHDSVVDFIDLNRVLSTFGQAGMGLVGDGNEDGTVDFFDLNDVLSLFGQSAPANPIPAPGAAAALIGLAGWAGARRRR